MKASKSVVVSKFYYLSVSLCAHYDPALVSTCLCVFVRSEDACKTMTICPKLTGWLQHEIN